MEKWLHNLFRSKVVFNQCADEASCTMYIGVDLSIPEISKKGFTWKTSHLKIYHAKDFVSHKFVIFLTLHHYTTPM